VVLGLVCLALGAQVDRIIIDDFTVGINNIFIQIPPSPAFPLQDNDFFTDTGSGANHLLGDERDLILIVNSGGVGSIVTSQAFSDANPPNWTTSCPQDGAGQGILQWDGKDGGSPTIAFTGLGGIDITENGLGVSFHASLTTDIDTTYTFDVYTSSSKKCTAAIPIPGNPGVTVDKFINFSSFTGTCSFANVGAIVLTVEANNNVDSTLFFLKTFGDDTPSVSRSSTKSASNTKLPSQSRTPSSEPSESRVPSDSRTPTPSRRAPSDSRTPSRSRIPPSDSRTPTPSKIPSQSRTPTPAPSRECFCHCPAFTCELVFDPDDDENNAYYFDDDNDGAPNNDDDGGNGNGNGNGNGGNGGSLASGASIIYVSGLLSLIVFALF